MTYGAAYVTALLDRIDELEHKVKTLEDLLRAKQTAERLYPATSNVVPFPGHSVKV